MSLKDIKGKIKSVRRTGQVTKAMEAVSAVKMRKSQLRALSGRPYAVAALSVLRYLRVSLEAVRHPLTVERPMKRLGLIVVTSDKGLCGALNAAVLKETERLLESIRMEKGAVSVYAFGRKAVDYFERRGYKLADKFENVSDDVAIHDVNELSWEVTRAFILQSYDALYVAYTHFVSTFEQKAVVRKLLPLSLPELKEMVRTILAPRGALLAATRLAGEAEDDERLPAFYTIESDTVTIAETLIPKLVGVALYHALLESKASEHSARMVAMKNASDKSRDLSKSLTRTFNKVRQAAITREVSEIVGGIEAMAR